MSAGLPDDDELLAAELAFGLIDGAEAAAALQRVDADPAFAAAHLRWLDYAAAMFSDAAEVPSAAVWQAIAARIPANDSAPRGSASTLRWWQAGAMAASVAALVLGVVAVRKPQTVVVQVPVSAQPSAPMVAVLTGKRGVVTVSYDPASGRMTSAVSGLDIGKHSPELWVIPADGKPRSMGVVHADTPSWGKVPEAASAVMGEGVTIAVTVEPLGGSPSGLPTGPVILSGKMVAV